MTGIEPRNLDSVLLKALDCIAFLEETPNLYVKKLTAMDYRHVLCCNLLLHRYWTFQEDCLLANCCQQTSCVARTGIKWGKMQLNGEHAATYKIRVICT